MRIIIELVLVAALGAAGFFGWSNLQKSNSAGAKITAATIEAQVSAEMLADSEKELETAEEELDQLREQLEPLQAKSLELAAVKAALAGGPILDDLESSYKKQKNISVERQLGLGALRMLTKGSDDPGAAEAFRKALQMSDWNSRKNSICAAQIGLAAAGEKIKVMSECAVQVPGAEPAAHAAGPAAHGDAHAAKGAEPDAHGAKPGKDAHGKDGKDAKHAAGGAHAAPHWGYDGAMGPDKWGNEFPTCGKGKAQSPLNIQGPFNKGRISVNADYKTGALKILNNGHTIQVNVPPGSKVRIDGVVFELLQFHFHRPSEEQIDGKPMAMVIHFVHKSAAGKLAVLGVLLKEGNENPGIKTLWQYAQPKEAPEMEVPDVTFNPANLLPREMDFFSYDGSLTTPPCTEGVRFFILKSPVNVSREQVTAFPFRANARPVQPLNGRTIITSN